MPSQFFKDPGAVLDYAIDWSAWLGEDTIEISTWSVPAGIVKTDDANTDTAATIWVSGGTSGQTYLLTNHIVTAAGREDERSITISVVDR